MINIVIPAAGDGTRFANAGYTQPKPLVDVLGKPMIKRVIDNLRPQQAHRVILVSKIKELESVLGRHDLNIVLTESTQGAVDTICRVKQYITESPILIANCDQLVDFDVNAFIRKADDFDGVLVTFKSDKPHHSYVTLDDQGVIQNIVEKQVISHHAVTGVYYFKNGASLIAAGEQVLADNSTRVRGEFYVSSAIAKMIQSGQRFVTYDAPSAMLGTPEELQLFELAVKVGRTL